VRGLVCSNPSREEVSVVAAAPVLPVTVVGAVQVTFCGSDPNEVTLAFDAGGRDPVDLFVVRVDENGKLTRLDVTLGDESLSVDVSESGTYAAIELSPPVNCDPRTHTGSVIADNNAALAPLGGITRLDGDLTINGAVTDLQALACLTWISGHLTLSETTALTALELGALAFVGGDISGNLDSALERVRFPRLLFAGGVGFTFEGRLTAVDLPRLIETPHGVQFAALGEETEEPLFLNLPNVQKTSGLHLSALDDLVDLDGFASLREVRGWLTVNSNPRLVRTDGLRSLELVSVRVEFAFNPLLERVDLGNLRSFGAYTDGGLWFVVMPKLTELDVGSLARVVGNLSIEVLGTEASEPLALDFRSLETVGSLSLREVSNLEDLSGFVALETISGGLTIRSNPSLANLRGLGALRELRGGLTVVDNNVLPLCEAFWLRDGLPILEGNVVISGSSTGTCP
jgi:hypothetical protein